MQVITDIKLIPFSGVLRVHLSCRPSLLFDDNNLSTAFLYLKSICPQYVSSTCTHLSAASVCLQRLYFRLQYSVPMYIRSPIYSLHLSIACIFLQYSSISRVHLSKVSIYLHSPPIFRTHLQVPIYLVFYNVSSAKPLCFHLQQYRDIIQSIRQSTFFLCLQSLSISSHYSATMSIVFLFTYYCNLLLYQSLTWQHPSICNFQLST